MKNEWKTRKLGELAELRGRIGWRGLTAKEYTKTGPYFLSVHSLNYGDYVDWRDAFHISDERYDESPEIMLKKDDVLICKDGAGIGKVGIVGKLPGRTTINSSLLLIRSGSDILPKFLYRCLASPYFQGIVQSRLNGATTPHLYQRDIAEFPVVLPPMNEQRRIVSVLDKACAGLATARANAERNLQNARALFEGHLQFAFTQRGRGWEEKRLDAFYEIGSSKRVLKSEWKSKGVPFYRGREITRLAMDGFVDNDLFLSEERFEDLARRSGIPKAGDIVITAIGTIGNAHIVRSGERFYFKDASVLWMRRNSDVSSEFIKFWLRSHLFKDQLDTGNGATVDTLTIQKLQSVRVRIPDREDQNRIVAQLKALSVETRRLEAIYQRRLSALAALKKSLLHQAFSGTL